MTTTTDATAGPLRIELRSHEHDEVCDYGRHGDAPEQAELPLADLGAPAGRSVQNAFVLLMVVVQLAWLGALGYGLSLL